MLEEFQFRNTGTLEHTERWELSIINKYKDTVDHVYDKSHTGLQVVIVKTLS